MALYLYFQLPFGKLHSKNPEIQKLAAAIDRTADSVAMKLGNFASLDPVIISSGRKGLSGASKLDREIYAQFLQKSDAVVPRAEAAWEAVVSDQQSSQQTAEIDRVKERSLNFYTERYQGNSEARAVSLQRIGQSFFRSAVTANYDGRCCITGIGDARLLVASHIKPWSVDVENRHNPANGFLLCATLDKAFDQGLITVNANLQVQVSKQLRGSPIKETRDYFQPLVGLPIRAPLRFQPDTSFLDFHSKEVFIDAQYGKMTTV